MFSVAHTDSELAEMHDKNRQYMVNVLGSDSKIIQLPSSESTPNVELVENYFLRAEQEHEGGIEDNVWRYISRWEEKHQIVFQVTQDGALLDISVIEAPLEVYRNGDILYAKKKDASFHCSVHLEFASQYVCEIERMLA